MNQEAPPSVGSDRMRLADLKSDFTSRKTAPANWLGFAMMCVGMFMAILDVQVVATSLPTIQTALNIRADQMSWVQTAYLIAEVVAIPLTGVLTRTLTMRWLFVGSVLMFTAASAACALSTTFPALILWRTVQGFSGGTLIPAVFSAIFLLFPRHRQGMATTIAGVLAVLAPTLGPVVGGWITDTLSWHWLFLINVLPGLVSAAIAAISLSADEPRLNKLRSLDVFAIALMAISLSALEIGLKEAPQRGWTSWYPVFLGVAFLIATTAFVRRVLARPGIVDLRAFRHRNFTIACILSFISGMGLFGAVYLMPIFLAYVRRHTALEIGAIMLVTGIAQLIAAPLAVWLEKRVDGRLMVATGFVLLSAGFFWSGHQTPRTDFHDMIGPQIIRGVATMLCLLPPTRLALGMLPEDEVPDASGLFNLMRNLGGAIGIALIDTVIFSNTASHAERIAGQLASGDAAALDFAGIPASAAQSFAVGADSEQLLALKGLVQSAATTQAINDAWLLIAALLTAALVFIPFCRSEGCRSAQESP